MVWRRRCFLGREIDLFALFQGVRGIDDHAVRGIDPLQHFQGIAEIPPNREFFQIDSPIRPDNGGHGPIGAEQKRVNRQGNALAG